MLGYVMAYVRTLLLLLLLSFSTHLQGLVPVVAVQVEEGGWGNAEVVDVQAVLDSVIVVIQPYIANPRIEMVQVRSNTDGPISLYERGENGEFVILLDVKGPYWAQLAYQFSHEMCHVITNYDLAPNNSSGQQWFDEALCEAFSLFVLEQMSSQWLEHPPYPNWRSYAPQFLKYREANLAEQHRQIPQGMRLPKWYQQYQTMLSDDPYARERELNELVATHLLPIFAENPENWRSINYLNLGDDDKDKSLAKFLEDWKMYAPTDFSLTIEHIEEILVKG